MTVLMPSQFGDIDHLLRRAGFGGHAHEIADLMTYDWADAVEIVISGTGTPTSAPPVPDLNPNRGWYDRYVDMLHFWLERARTQTSPIVEKMVLFWHGHLCSSLDKVYDHRLLFDQNQLFRTHGLGQFGALLHAVSLQPAMLFYLDNHRNEAGDPNENFARELMELFTLGVGHYTEDDVRESARAWTGYGLNDDDIGEGPIVYHVLDESRHDGGQKTFMGVTKAWRGPEIIDHLLYQSPQATMARFISAKIWSFFAYPDPDPALVDDLANAFVVGGLEIRALLRAVFNRPEFRSPQAKNALVRPPIDFAVAGMRRTGLACSEAHPEWYLSEMGQAAFRPPNVAGWKQNDYWISPTATWAKRGFASTMRWAGLDTGLLANSGDLTPDQAVEQALLLFGIYNVSPPSYQTLLSFVQNERAINGWAERAGLLLLTPLTPEFQLA